jgi:hypothetical protein
LGLMCHSQRPARIVPCGIKFSIPLVTPSDAICAERRGIMGGIEAARRRRV